VDRNFRSPLTRYLDRSPDLVFSLYAAAAAFTAYFCMYAFRKPFLATSYEDTEMAVRFFGQLLEPKTVFVISQLIGYATSKYLGMKFCSEAQRGRLWLYLLLLILTAWATLLLFAVLPPYLKILAIFCNGLPLGMVWGVVVRYLEGRHTSELLLAGLSCSYIVASGIVKSVGARLMKGEVSFGPWLIKIPEVPEFWMPFATGAIFLLPFFLAVFLLSRLPPPTENDIRLRSERNTMGRSDRWKFLKTFLPGMILLCLAYFFLTAYRDFRDNFQAELFSDLKITDPAAFNRTETPIAFGVMASLVVLYFIRNNRLGLIGAYVIMIGGLTLMGLSTLLFQTGQIGGETWMILSGLGAYLAYVPYGSVLFDRTIAHTHFAGTAVFAIYLTDAIGYTGSVGATLYKDLFQAESSRLDFMLGFTNFMAILGFVLLLFSLLYFLRVKPASASPKASPEPDSST
jgi:MFS family permease